MNKEYQQEWVKRLRSGEYPQGKKCLNDGDLSYCCLGVLCEIGVEKGDLIKTTGPTRSYRYTTRDSASTIQLPTSFKQIVGLDCHIETALMELNDTHGKTFNEIADFIEEIG